MKTAFTVFVLGFISYVAIATLFLLERVL